MSALVVRSQRVDYLEAWATQRRLADRRRRGELPDLLWLLEHPPVYTYGRHATREDLFDDDVTLDRLGATCVQVDRGGQMTWHGPGQTVAYLIVDLRPRHSVRRFVCALTEAMADAAGGEARSDARAPGAYVAGRKIGSVGIRVERGVTTHGLALNRDVDLGWFARMTACGAPEVPATSIRAEGGDPTRALVEDRLVAALAARLACPFEPAELGDLLAGPGAAPPRNGTRAAG